MWIETHKFSETFCFLVFGEGPRKQENHLYTISVSATGVVEVTLRGSWVPSSNNPKNGFYRQHIFNLVKYTKELPKVITEAIANALKELAEP